MNETIELKFYDNKRHGYLRVSEYDLQGWGILPTEFSEYSYYDSFHAYLYLEEDCDAPKFIKILKDKFGIDVKINKEIRASDFFSDSAQYLRNKWNRYNSKYDSEHESGISTW